MDIFLAEPKESNNEYETRKHLREYYKRITALSYKTDEGKELYIRIFEMAGYRHLKESLLSDIKELDICLSSKAYKATLIMAGSVLEAFLLDWLSEIDGVNYFEKPYYVTVTDKDGKTKKRKCESLDAYINQIKEIEKPDWMEESTKAHFIRKSRNSVHAKVCLKEEVGINEETCIKVIDYLKDIVNARLDKIKKP